MYSNMYSKLVQLISAYIVFNSITDFIEWKINSHVLDSQRHIFIIEEEGVQNFKNFGQER